MTWKWFLQKDFIQVLDYGNSDLFKARDQSLGMVWTKLIVGKSIHIGIFYVLPTLLGAPWFMVLWGNFLMHVMAGFILSITFQLAHVVDKAEFPTEEEVKQSSIFGAPIENHCKLCYQELAGDLVYWRIELPS